MHLKDKSLIKLLILATIGLLVSLSTHGAAFAQEPTTAQTELNYKIYRLQDLNSTGVHLKSVFAGENLNVPITENTPLNLKKGDLVVVLATKDAFYITDIFRLHYVALLVMLFMLVVIAIARVWGILSILGLAYSITVVYFVLLKNILAGYDALVVTFITVLLIAPVTFYTAHGFNSKTTVAMVSTFIALSITWILAVIFANLTSLTGFAQEEAYFINMQNQVINIKGLLLSGIIISTLGILDDATISQAAIANELRYHNPTISPKELFVSAMRVGHDHITSTVNTLVLVYTGSAMPLLLLVMLNRSENLLVTLNSEIIVEEIVKTLIASLGLVLSVPIATLLASYTKTAANDKLPHKH